MKLLFPYKKKIAIFLAQFVKDKLPSCNNDKRRKIVSTPLDSSSFDAGEILQSRYKKTIKQITKTVFQRSTILNDSDFTDNDDQSEKSRW